MDSPRVGIADWMRLVRFSHSIFALPFALIALLVATDGRPGWWTLLLVVLAMVFARTAAMAYNRWADREIDAANPRTKDREIPAGKLSANAVLAFTIANALAFVSVSALLGTACAVMAPVALLVLFGYSHAKRFTDFAHVWLGVALGLAPPAAWLAARGQFTPDFVSAVVLGVGVALWVAGFDVLYSLQDERFDRQRGLRSIPVRVGTVAALRAARLLHALSALAFFGFGALCPALGWPYFVGVGLATALLWYEHRLVKPDDLGRIDMAFFTMNGAVGLAMLGFTAVDLYLL